MSHPVSARALAELRAQLRGDLLTDDLSRSLYSTDASLFQIKPLAVAVPRDEDDVVALVKFAAEHRVPLVGRGAGSGMAGESLGSGMIVDFSRHFRAIEAVGSDWARVQPGVVLSQLNQRLAREGRRFGPDSASETYCTLGGMWANNASGSRLIKHGYTHEHVRTLRTVLANGSVEEFASEPRPAATASPRDQLLARLAELVEAERPLIQACQPRTPYNRCGYRLHDLLVAGRLEMPRLLVGSEGTLGLFTAATIRTIPVPAERVVALYGFPSLEQAARAVPRCLPAQPSACELVERRLLALACEARPEYATLIHAGVQAVLLLEFEGEAPGQARQAAGDLDWRLVADPGLQVSASLVSRSAEEADWLWKLRDLAVPMLHALPGMDDPLPYIEDVGVPVLALADYLRELQDLLKARQITASFLIHAGAGQVHMRPFLNLSRPDHVQRLRDLAAAVYNLVFRLGGTVSTQHGVGLARTPWLVPQYGRLHQVFREVKRLFDPQHLLNPGKLVGPVGDPLSQHPRVTALTRIADKPLLELQLVWPAGAVEAQCQACSGCGACRTQEPGQRMCPTFRATGDEAATPRAKVNLLRDLLGGGVPLTELPSDAVRAVADLCINCKMCAVECPAHVNIPKLMLEVKAQHVAEHGLTWSDWFLARLESFAGLGSAFAWLTNAVLNSRSARWLLSGVLGLSRRRTLLRLATTSFLKRAQRRGLTRKPVGVTGLKVAYFTDVVANYLEPSIAEATVAVLEHNGIQVYVPPKQVGCGMVPLAAGDVDTARKTAQRNLNFLADLAREGFAIVCSEPTAAVAIKHDYRDLVADPDADLVAQQTVELTTFLWRLYKAGQLRTDFHAMPCTIGHHVPCHVKALDEGVAGPLLLSLIPQTRVRTIDVSCSGMAGTFGLKDAHVELSLAAGAPMLEQLARDEIHFGSSECTACRLQMIEGTRKPVLHPVQYLALAYGLHTESGQPLFQSKAR